MSGVDFWHAVTLKGRASCWACEVWPGDKGKCRHLSAGILDAHHVCAKSVLKREFPHGAYVYEDGSVDRVLAEHRRVIAPNAGEVNGVRVLALDDILWDGRNGVPVARWHHDALEHRTRTIPRAVLPPAVEEFAAELGLEWLIERTYGPREAAA